MSIISDEDDSSKGMEPDLGISPLEPGNGKTGARATSASSAIAIAEPVIIQVKLLDATRQRFLKILHRPGNKVITVLELLSPSNKEAKGRDQYLRKRNALLLEPVNLVELDLLRRGKRLPMAEPLSAGDYFAIVTRATSELRAEVYAWSVRFGMPTIRIPLRPADGDVILRLQDLFTVTYQRGRYEQHIDYTAEPSIPLSPEDAGWVKELIARHQP